MLYPTSVWRQLHNVHFLNYYGPKHMGLALACASVDIVLPVCNAVVHTQIIVAGVLFVFSIYHIKSWCKLMQPNSNEDRWAFSTLTVVQGP